MCLQNIIIRPCGFGVVPLSKLRGMERFWCAACQHVTSGIPADPADRDGLLKCPRCGATCVECPTCGEITGTLVPEANRWRCDKCQEWLPHGSVYIRQTNLQKLKN